MNAPGPSFLRRHKTALLIVSGVVLIAILAIAVAFERKWPFTPQGVTKRLHQHSSATVEFGSFRELFFPQPGFVAEQVVLRRSPTSPPIVTIRRLTVLADYSGLIGPSKTITRVRADGLVVRVFTRGMSENLEFHRGTQQQEGLTLDHLVADNSTLEIVTGGNTKPLLFPISRLRVDHLGEHTASKFEIALQNPKPVMQVAAKGEFGPWHAGNILLTPVSGSYSVSNGKLGTVPGIDGTLTSTGQFKGEIENIAVSGRVEVADFELRKVQHPMPLRVQFDSVVGTSSAQIKLQSVDAQLGATDMKGSGIIWLKNHQPPDLVHLSLECEHGRVDDLLRLFVSSPKPSMSGPIRFHTTADLVREKEPFLKRVRLNGNFVITDAHFTSPITQNKLNKLSARSQGDKNEDPPDRAVSLLSSGVKMEGGIARLSDVKFQVPGADANGGATFNVLTLQVRGQGKLRMKAELSHATKGVKSFFLSLIDGLFEKHGAGAEVPVHITGTSKHPKFKAGL